MSPLPLILIPFLRHPILASVPNALPSSVSQGPGGRLFLSQAHPGIVLCLHVPSLPLPQTQNLLRMRVWHFELYLASNDLAWLPAPLRPDSGIGCQPSVLNFSICAAMVPGSPCLPNTRVLPIGLPRPLRTTRHPRCSASPYVITEGVPRSTPDTQFFDGWLGSTAGRFADTHLIEQVNFARFGPVRSDCEFCEGIPKRVAACLKVQLARSREQI